MITPACSGDAGAATELLDAMGSSRVTKTPSPNSAIRTTSVSGLRFTEVRSLNKTASPVWMGVAVLTSSFCPSNAHVLSVFVTYSHLRGEFKLAFSEMKPRNPH
jgi:hypothetical protein